MCGCLSSFDKRCLELLAPLKQSKPKLYFPFFANTLPIAFHYGVILDEICPDLTSELIRLVPWDFQIPELVDDESKISNVIYFGTPISSTAKHSTAKVSVGYYNPRSIFTEYSLHASEYISTGKIYGHSELARLLETLAAPYSNCIQVRTELGDQAKALMDSLQIKGVRYQTTSTSVGMSDIGPSLNIFLYGAPLTRYLRKKRSRFIEIRLDDQLVSTDKAYETFIYIRHLDHDSSIYSTILRYWDFVSENYKERRRDSFWALCDAYNHLARTIQHRSSFPDAESYMLCLNEHSYATSV